MFADETRARLRFLPLLAAVLALALFAGCGDDDDEGDGGGGGEAAAEAQPVDVTFSGEGSFEGPKQIQAGLNEITFTNEGKDSADLQLIYVEGEHPLPEVEKAFQKAGAGTPFPDWFFGGGGVGTTEAGSSRTVTQVLQPGSYYGFNTEAGGKPPSIAFEVTGEEGDAELPEGEGTVSAFEYGFEAEGLQAGTGQIRFDNTGAQPHHVIAFPIVGDATLPEVEKFLKTEKGKPPVDFEGIRSTAVLEGGTGQITDLELKKGRYAFVCFISDRQGGPPHVAKGMVSEIEVE